MPVEFICDSCGKRKKGYFNHMGDAMKPATWYQRTVKDAEGDKITQVACSRECIHKLGGVVAPW